MTRVHDLRALPLLAGLDDDQVAELYAAGEARAFGAGEELFREHRPAEDWWLLLDGAITLTRHVGHEETEIGRMAVPGQWAGGFRAWDDHGVYLATGRGSIDGNVLRVPAPALRRIAESWFPFGVHLIQGLAGSVRRIEGAARQREALVALGTLAAGLAHEINNPASAATRAVDALQETTADLLTCLGRLVGAHITAVQFVALDELRRQLDEGPAAVDALAMADREDALSDWLSAHGVERHWSIAPALAAAGADPAWCDRVTEVLPGVPADAALEWVAASLTMSSLLREVKESTARISELVDAVKSYSHLDRASVEPVDVREGLTSTLVMLGHRLEGVRVVRDVADDLPRVPANAGELNQVWTNLVDNAVDAMDGSGTLTVSAHADDRGVVVEIADTGTGMPEHIRAHAFEPFFTTKDVGQGTGLGLDIARRVVVERHGGDIAIETGPGGTTLKVRLPLRAAGPAPERSRRTA